MDEWENVRAKIKNLEKSFLKTKRTDRPTKDSATVANFWKNRYEEEKRMWSQMLANKEKEQSDIREKFSRDDANIHSLESKIKELEQRLHSEKKLWEELSKIKLLETSLEKKEIEWEEKLALLKEDSDSLKAKILTGEALTQKENTQKKELEEQRKKIEEENELLKQRIEDFTREEHRKMVELDMEKKELKKQLDELKSRSSNDTQKSDQLNQELSQKMEEKNRQLALIEHKEKEHIKTFENLTNAFAHKVRNHLGITSGILQSCIQHFGMDDELKNQISYINQNSKDMFLTVEEFLQFANIPKLNVKPTHINQILDDTLELLIKIAEEKGIVIHKKLSDRIPYCKIDPIVFSEAMSGIVENAIESSSKGKSISIESLYDEKTQTAKIVVKDSGHGIPANLLDKVTQPYFTSRKGKRGMGLALAKRAMEVHLGTLKLTSKEGEGTTVNLSIPTSPLAS